jgi:hypothetical protein
MPRESTRSASRKNNYSVIVYATIRFVKRAPVIFPEGIRIRARPRRASVTGGHAWMHRPRRRIHTTAVGCRCVQPASLPPRRREVSLQGHGRRLRNRRRDVPGAGLRCYSKQARACGLQLPKQARACGLQLLARWRGRGIFARGGGVAVRGR